MCQSNSLVTFHSVNYSLYQPSLIIFRCLERFKNPWFIDSGSKHSDFTRWVFRLTECVIFGAHYNQYAFKSLSSRLKLGRYSSKPLVIFFQSCKKINTKIGQLSVTGLSNEKQSIESTNNCLTRLSLVSLSVFLFGHSKHSKHSSVYMLV